MRLLDLNVNGFKAFVEKGGFDYIRKVDPDIICLQETRTDKIEKPGNDYSYAFFNRAFRKGYAGTLIFSKTKPLNDLTKEYDFSGEGRIQVLEFDGFILVNVYVPSSLRDPNRFSYRLEFNEKFIELAEYLNNIKPVIICGDFNCVRSTLDMDCHAKDYEEDEFHSSEKEILPDLENLGFYDPVRQLHRNKKSIYSWRSPKNDVRFGSQGRRLDYCYLNRYFPKDLVANISYDSEAGLSDHYPMIVEFDSLETLSEDFDLRKQWEQIDLEAAKVSYSDLIEKAKEAIQNKDSRQYGECLLAIAGSTDVKALAVEEAVNAKAAPIVQLNWHYSHNKMRGLNGIDLANHVMDNVFYFEAEEKGKIRKIGKLSNKDYAAHYLMAQLIKPYHDLNCDEHSYAYLEDKSHIDLHSELQEYIAKDYRLNYITILDIQNFFGSLDHEWLCSNIPVPPSYLRNILTSVNIIDGKSIPSNGKGISMGSPVAAYLANICLNGMEEYVCNNLKGIFGRETPVRFLRFSDDIVILTETIQQADFAKFLAEQFLGERKLKISPEKSIIANFREDSFVLMNWKYRLEKNNLYVEPTDERIGFMMKEVEEIISKDLSPVKLIKRLNEKIIGWSNDLRYCESSYAFRKLDDFIERLLTEKTFGSFRFLNETILDSRYFVNIGGRKHFCLPKDKAVQVKKLSATPLIKHKYTVVDNSEITRQKLRVNEKYRGAWRKQDGRCAVCGERILPNEKRRLVKINKKDAYVHYNCRGKPVDRNNVIFDITTQPQIEKALLSEEPYLTDDYIFPGLLFRREETRRQMLHRSDDEVLSFLEDEVNTKTKVYRRTEHYFGKSLRYEGYLHYRNGSKISVRQQQSRHLRLQLPDKLDELLDPDDIMILKNFMTFLKKYYDL